MERQSVYQEVDKVVCEMTTFEGYNASRSRLTVEQILGWLPPALIDGPAIEIATERAKQWVHPAKTVAHFHDPSDVSRSICGVRADQLDSLLTPEARHYFVSGEPHGAELCEKCAAMR